MKIAWISYDFGEYSIRHATALAQDHRVSLLANASGFDHQVLLALPRPQLGEHASELDPAVQLYAFDKPRLRQPWQQLSSIRRLLRVIRDFDPDVIHYQQGHLWFNFALPRLKRYPLVITIHDPRHHAGDAVSQKTPQWVMDYGFRCADQVVVHGQNLVGEVHRHVGISRERIHVIPHVAIGQVASTGGVSRSSLPSATPEDEGPVILFFGRIWDYKGLDYLIDAEPLIAQEFPHVKIVIAGEGDDFQKYERRMQHSDRFEIHNTWITDEERAHFFQRATIVVLPYTEATQSGVVPVAYTYGRAVVATRVGALPECIDDGVTGILVPPRDVPALAAAIVELLRDPERCRAMGDAGKVKLDRESSPAVVAAQLTKLYEKAISQHPVASRTMRARDVATSTSTKGPLPKSSPSSQPTLKR